MRRQLLTLALIGAAGVSTLQAQSFSDDFESYNLGKLGPQSANWTTWDGTEGGATDPNVVNTDAHSGTKSVYFSSTSSSGGPEDCVLPFGGVYTSGNFVFSSWFKVKTGKGAYFNIQGKAAVGGLYSLDCQMDETGVISFKSTGALLLSTTYTHDTWFQLTLDINLSTNNWDVKINGTSVGSFANPSNQVASIDIYPVNASNSQAAYWVDDVSYAYTPYVLPAVNGAITALLVENGLVGQSRKPSVTIRNLGTAAITSFDVKVDNNGSIQTQNVTGVNIASYALYTVDFTSPITLVAGANTIVATLSNVNGSATDDDATDDSKTVSVTPVQAAPGRNIIVEEATGTWCQWCPRGAVFMKKMHDKYEDRFIGIAVHNGDPMTFDPYDQAMGARVGGYPSALVNRGTVIDPSEMEQGLLQDITVEGNATFITGAKYDANTHTLDVSLSATFSQATSGAYKVACILTEDSVKGTTSKYSQSNAYANNAAGPMGGFEKLPNPVPASKMTYDHVARLISPSFDGVPNAYPATINANDKFVHNFTFNLDPSWKYKKINIVGMLISPNGKINNGVSASIDDAIANGFVTGTAITAVKDLSSSKTVSVNPNPANNISFVTVNLENASNVEIALYQLNGKQVSNINYGKLTGTNKLSVDVSQLEAGIYLLKVSVDGLPHVSKLIVE